MKDLKCYAYWENIDGIQCRYGTILVGKGNERIVGNCVMKNPGSSLPINNISFREDGRKEFTVDATMNAVAELFGIDKNGGLVRIFNLSDAREPDFSKAKKIIRHVDNITSLDNTVPTYIGWGDFWKNKDVSEIAKCLFEIVQPNNAYLKDKIDTNPFFHPLYLMRYGRNKNECKTIINSFNTLA